MDTTDKLKPLLLSLVWPQSAVSQVDTGELTDVDQCDLSYRFFSVTVIVTVNKNISVTVTVMKTF